ncbi:VOC family protein [Nocardia iowensis]|uniref:VOC family protein n=1 Tax=Nocardia iowensis TaxID=204891 RepID=A0ABX8RFS9_NOCIO|nr:VOC family protein [Nocardia iowensis]QXN88453.1 VOC family protein [Nocardia iowensis]
MSQQQSNPTARIVPLLVYDDPVAMIGWLEQAFGFTERPDTRIVSDGDVHAELEVDGSGLIMLAAPSVHGVSPKVGVSSTTMIDVDDVDAHCARARAAGAKIIIEPEQAFWGDRRYQAADVEGHLWHFQQRKQA